MGQEKSASCKRCRRSGQKLYLKGLRCNTAKCSQEKRNFAPGKSAGSSMRKISEYGIMLREKQKVKFIYGISERQLQGYYKKADRAKDMTGHVLLALCESRLDNVIKRSKFVKSRREGRLLIGHGFFRLNNKKVDIPSIIVKPGDKITVSDNKKEYIIKNYENLKDFSIPEWINFNEKDKTISIERSPNRDEIDTDIQEQLIVEYYSQ